MVGPPHSLIDCSTNVAKSEQDVGHKVDLGYDIFVDTLDQE